MAENPENKTMTKFVSASRFFGRQDSKPFLGLLDKARAPGTEFGLFKARYFGCVEVLSSAESPQKQAIDAMLRIFASKVHPTQSKIVITTKGVFLLEASTEAKIASIGVKDVYCCVGMKRSASSREHKVIAFLIRVKDKKTGGAGPPAALIFKMKKEAEANRLTAAFESMVQACIRDALFASAVLEDNAADDADYAEIDDLDEPASPSSPRHSMGGRRLSASFI